MLSRKMNTIKCEDGRSYPICCTLSVLEQIQHKYGHITKFQKLASGIRENEKAEREEERYTFGPVDVPAVLDGLLWMLNEGIEIENEEKEAGKPLIENRKEAARIIRCSELSLSEVAAMVVNEMLVCIDPKKQQSVQRKEKMTNPSLTLHGFFIRLKDILTVRKRK